MTPARCTPLVSVVFPTYQRAEPCLRLLRSLAEQTLDPTLFEVLPVDDGSRDDTTDVLDAFADEAPYVLRPQRLDVNRGPAAARNLGWQQAEAPIIAFIDDDCVPAPGWLEAGLAAITADQRIGVLQGRTKAPAGIDLGALPRWCHYHVISGPTSRFEGCNVFYRRRAIAEGGGFDEDIAWWGEDTSAGWRVLDAGWRSGFSDAAQVVHDVSSRGLRWNIRNGFNEHNVVRLASEHPGFRSQVFWRSWAFRREDAAFILAVAAAVVGIRWRPALLAGLPYLWCRRPGSWTPGGVRTSCECVPVDAARAMGQLRGAIRYRVAVL